MIDIRLPNITATTDRGQLEQIRSYLYQFARQLNWALSTIDTKADEAKTKIEANTQQKDAVEQAQATFSEVKSLIIKSADIVNAYYEEINRRLEGIYVAQSDFGTYKEETSATLEANSTSINVLFDNQQSITTNVGNLSTSLDSTKEDVSSLSTSLDSTKDDVSSLSTSLDSTKEDVSSLSGDLGKVTEDVSGLSDSLDSTKADVADLGTRLDEDISGLNESLNSTNQSISDLSGELDGAKDQVSNLSDSLDSTKDDVAALDSNLESVEQNVESINDVLQSDAESTTIIGSQAWCKIGVLAYEESGFPIYGMEIGQVNTQDGQTVYNKFAQYRSDGVHLFDQNGIEVATISDYKLSITNAEIINAEITGSLKLGGYAISTTNGLAFKWAGRG